MFVYTGKRGVPGFAATFILHSHHVEDAPWHTWAHLSLGRSPAEQRTLVLTGEKLSSLGAWAPALRSDKVTSWFCFSCEMSLVPAITNELKGPQIQFLNDKNGWIPRKSFETERCEGGLVRLLL